MPKNREMVYRFYMKLLSYLLIGTAGLLFSFPLTFLYFITDYEEIKSGKPPIYRPEHMEDRHRERRGVVKDITEAKIEPDPSTSFDMKGDDTLAKALAKRLKIFCWISTMPTRHEVRAKYVKDTWLKHCDDYIFISYGNDSSLPAVGFSVPVEEGMPGRKWLWKKAKFAYNYIYDNHKDYDWIFKADDDTYAMIENLRYMLLSYSPEDPVYFGCKYNKYTAQGYMSGGSGYAMSREALRRLVVEGIRKNCKAADFGSEDVETGKCLYQTGVIAGDSRDETGRSRFLPFRPGDFLLPSHGHPKWFHDNIYYKITQGKECCSDHVVAFHYIRPLLMYTLEYLMYHVKIYGIGSSYVKATDGRIHPIANVDSEALLNIVRQESLRDRVLKN